MAHPEQGLEVDQGQQARTLSLDATQRVVLRLVSSFGRPLNRDDMDVLSREVKGDTKPPEYELTLVKDSFIVEFHAAEDAEPDVLLKKAVNQTGKVILANMFPLELSHAWTFPADAPTVKQLTTEGWEEHATDVTETAQALFAQNNEQSFSADVDWLLFQAPPPEL